MRYYLLKFTAELDTDALPAVGRDTTAKDVAYALRDAADEIEDYADWQIGIGSAGNDPVALDVKDTRNDDELVDAIKHAVAAHFRLKYVTVGDVSVTSREYRDVDFPDWALCALVNGDPLEDAEDRRNYDAWEKRMLAEGYDLLSPDVLDDRNEFFGHPEFGLACATTKVRFFKDGKGVGHAT